MQTSDSSSKHGEENYVAHLWILRLQDSLSCLIRSRMAASILLFYLPSIVSGLLLEWILKEHFITRGIHIALVWLALAPLLIQEAFRMLINFFDIHKHIFLSEKDWQEFKDAEVGRIQSSRYLVFGIPWTVVVVLIVLVSLFRESSIPVKVWASVTLSILFLLGSIGFHGIYVLVTMMPKLCSSAIQFQPYHPDRFGGMAAIGVFALKTAVLFSSGCLIFPLVFEVIRRSATMSNLTLVAGYICISAFVCTMIAAFILPVISIKQFADKEKVKIILAARGELDRLTEKFNASEPFNLKAFLQIAVYYHLNYAQLLELKTYPYDVKTVIQFIFATILPIGMTVFERFIR